MRSHVHCAARVRARLAGASLIVALAFVAFVTPGGGVSTAVAAGKGAAKKPKTAADWYAEGAKHHKAGEYEAAAAAYRAAYALEPDLVYLFNLAQVFRLAGNWVEAERHYTLYLSDPSAPLRDEAERHLADVKAHLGPS